ncbi:phosphotransferase [Nocardiopsis sp. HNM0947]|uniref:Phosphotransferase n=1 Tax=Nocardiopsis coralli TaxID=2772213 RepID=A0ABR9P923_9ACTN|nr:aminoglycoside phosphotransferase family protein [Nocardiopsis coralli]MBE3000343.1 phosphotransferase [Nocardiopsis coralli]
MELPDLVRQRATRLGAAGTAWLNGLEDLVAELEQRWAITVGPPLSGGSAAYVARARDAEGRDAVLKIDPPDPELGTFDRVHVLRTAGGRGYVRLLADDAEHRALLLEGLGGPLSRAGLSPERQMGVLCDVLAQAWQVPRPSAATREQAQRKAVELGALVSSLWEKQDRPCPERVVDLALDFAEQRRAGTALEGAVVVHGDPHPDNALRVPVPRAGARSGYVLVDPDGFLADPAYDLGVVLRGWCTELLSGSPADAVVRARGYCRLLASRSGLDATAIWQWGFVERVSSGLYLLELGAGELGRQYLDSAERLASAERA